MIKLKNISKAFGDKQVLKDIHFEIKEGEIATLLGTNGSGKSTLLDIIAGKLAANQGSLWLHGEDITTTSAQKRAAWIARLMQDPRANTIGHMTVAQNLAMAMFKNKFSSLKMGSSAITGIVGKINHEHAVDLRPLLNTKMGSLSGGQRQLIAFIMATLIPPKLLLLDEPTAALDPQAAILLLSCMQQFVKKHKITTILITHDPQIALNIGNKILLLNNGALKTFNAFEMQSLHAQDLVGHIDYERLKTT